MTMIIIYAILTLITLFDLFIFANELRKENLSFTCPFCKHQAPDKEFGPTSGLVIMLLLLFGVLPGILYIIS